MMDAGRLKTRLLIEAPVEADDGQGGVTRDYVAQATVWAAVTPVSASRAIDADADGATVRVRIILRSNVQLTLQHRLIDGDHIYRIVSLRDVDDGQFIEIDADYRIG